MFKHFVVALAVSQLLSACTVAGVLVDGAIYSKADENYDADLALSPAHVAPEKDFPVGDQQTFSFSELGLEVDRFLVGLVQQQSQPQVLCKRVTKTLKECEEVPADNLTQEQTIEPANTIDEIIGVRQ
ncbi:hypothetical protein CWB85_05500 [Pseudoalteromonas sp. S1727]|uniref:hypothetical protein n=1 Tax=Pseudoalteromonas sp. S1727 TaxID=2066514 RepID=UPI001107C3E4|nr:hypothetical protein [Pseudoalteromonas sp. S1727]TMN72901.1 hypothetical protein CWB85_05500 [Pseudoalteromonas sp. S1727]